MTAFDTYAGDTVWYDEEWYLEDDYQEAIGWQPAPRLPHELVMFGAVGLIMLIAVALVLSRPVVAPQSAAPAADTAVAAQPQSSTQADDTAAPGAPVAPPLFDPTSFASIYDDYIITQGPHGASYGHHAIDIAAGNGEVIKSPIYGTVTQLFADEWGNTTLVIENDAYAVTFLHGLYSVTLGQEITQGDVIGTESNQGNTYDMAGNSCRGRNCGYHTHLNVFDKRLGQNVNPLDLF